MTGTEVDVEKLEILRRWGSGLQDDSRGEVAAAGRAILLLIEEIERLHVLVWDRRLYPDMPPPPPPAPAPPVEPEHDSPHTSLVSGLRNRLRRAHGDAEALPRGESTGEDR